MLRVTLAGLRTHPLRYVLTGVVVVLSVGFTAGTLVLTDSLNQAAATEGAASAGHLRIPLLMLGAVSLIVAAFVIANTFRILVAQRTRELALLRTVGATRRQVSFGVLLEAAAVGLGGGLAGVALGIVAGSVAGQLIADGTHDLPIVVSAPSVLWPLALGLAVTVGSAIQPARAATRVAPQAAVQTVPDAEDSQSTRRVRARSGLTLVCLGGVLLLLGAVVSVGYLGLVIVVVGATLCFLGIVVLGPRIVPPVLRVLGKVAGRMSGSARPTTELATANAVRNPRRAAATSAALLIGVTVVTGFVTVGESTRASIDVVLDQQVPADFVVTPQIADSVPAEAIEAIEALPEMGASVALYRDTIDSAELGSVDVIGLDLNAYERIARVDGDGSREDLATGDAAIDRGTASTNGLSLGDVVTVGDKALRIGYLVDERSVPYTGVMVLPEVFLQVFPDVDGPEQFAIDAEQGIETSEARAAIEATVDTIPDVSVYSNIESKEQINSELDRAVGVVVAILGLAVVIAGIGMANTLSLAVHERTREIGLLRALGVTGRETRVMLGIEAVLASFVAAIMGTVVGVVFSWAAVTSIPNLVFAVPWARLGLCLLAAAALGLLASVLPARRAARVSPVVALAAQ